MLTIHLPFQTRHRPVGRIYEDSTTLPDQRWFWSITVYVDLAHEIVTSGRTATLEDAKLLFRLHWGVAKPHAKM